MKLILGSTLLFCLCSYILGILTFLSAESRIILMVVGGVFLLGTMGLSKKRPGFLYFIFYSLFFLLGFLAMDKSFPVQNQAIVEGDVFYYGKVKQQLNTGETWSSSLIEIQAIRMYTGEWMTTKEKIVLMTENGFFPLIKNDFLLFSCNLNLIEPQGNPGEFNAKKYWISKGIRYQGFCSKEDVMLMEHLPLHPFQELIENVRAYSTRILDQWVGEEDGPLIKAILLGDKSDLDMETKRAFMNTGAMHMLAVSGMHVGLIVVLLLYVLKQVFFHRGRLVAMLLMIVLLWFYAFLTGFSASVVRAVMMFSVLILAQVLQRGYQPINSLAIAGFFILVIDPLSVFDIGFQLSFLAILGIFTVFPLLDNVLVFRNDILNQAWKGTAIGLASQVFTVPISLYYFNQFPNYFILTNFAVMIFSGVMLGLAIGLLAIGSLAFIAAPIGWFLALCCSLLVGFISFVEFLPGALSVGFSPSWVWVVMVYVFCFCSLVWMKERRWLAVLSCLVPIVLSLQWGRFQNLNNQEWVIFNSNYPTLLFNNGSHKVCFYGGNEKGKKLAMRMVGDYTKIHAGVVEFLPLSEEEYQFSLKETHFTVSKEYGWISIVQGQQKYALITSSKTNLSEIEASTKIITMRKTTQENVFYNLPNGAFRGKL